MREHERHREAIERARPGAMARETREQRGVLGARVRRGQPAVGEDLLRDHAEPAACAAARTRRQRRLEHVERRLHDVEHALAVDARGEGELERAPPTSAPLEREPERAVAPARRPSTSAASSALVVEAARLRVALWIW